MRSQRHKKMTLGEMKRKERMAAEVAGSQEAVCTKPANKELNAELLRRYKEQGDESALEELVKVNKPLVVSIAKRFLQPQNPLYDFDDVVQCGMVGLIKAVEKFDMDRIDEVSFSTYAVWWIKCVISKEAGVMSGGSIPINLAHQFFGVLRIETAAETEGHPLTTEELEEVCKSRGLTLEKYTSIKNVVSPMSLNQTCGVDDDCDELVNLVASDNNTEEEAISSVISKELLELVDKLLRPKYNYVLKSYFGLELPRKTLCELSSELGVSRQRVQQMVASSVDVLRKSSEFRTEIGKDEDTVSRVQYLRRMCFKAKEEKAPRELKKT